jgi:multicomponent Na+:H+ antiporter subunit D
LLLEHGLVFAPFALDRLAPALEIISAASASYVILRTIRILPVERRVRILDLDSLYRGPMAWIGRLAGAVLLRLYGAVQTGFDASGRSITARFTAWARRCDRPYAERWAPAAQLAAIAAVLAIVLLARR